MNVPFLSLQDITRKYSNELHEAVNRVVDSGWYLLGAEIERFERDYADYIGSRFCIGTANGLDSLSLILRAYIELGVMRPGDEILVPANTYIASILAITENGLVPVLIEPDINTFQINENEIEQRITKRTKALMLVHLYGRCAYTEHIAALCRKYGLKLVEDNAQAHGCRYRGKRTGSLGDAAGHSFYPGKNLGAFGDGGAVTTSSEELADVVRALANYGSAQKYICKYRGRNSRLDEIQAAVLSVKLAHLDEDIAARQEVAGRYMQEISNPAIVLPEVQNRESHVFHIFPVLSQRRERLQRHLAEQGIQTLIHYPVPPHKQECYRELNSLSLPVTEEIHACELSLPMSPVLSDEQIDHVIRIVNEWDSAK
jgi:dTDP-4-amino-4,6-dideoxygalactose transaminase